MHRFQLIIEATGDIIFQYDNIINDEYLNNHTCIGLENQDGTIGIDCPEENLLNFENPYDPADRKLDITTNIGIRFQKGIHF